MTAAGLAAARMLAPSDTIARDKADRQWEQASKRIIEFQRVLIDRFKRDLLLLA